MRILRALRIIAVFAVLGPLSGLAQLYVLAATTSSGPPLGRPGSDLWWWAVTLILSVALVPALAAGILSGVLTAAGQPRWRVWLLTLLAGVLVSLVFGFAISGNVRAPLLMAAVGVVSVVVCQGVVDMAGALRRR